MYVRLSVITLVGHFHLGDWLPDVLPEFVWALVRLGCAAGTWQETCTSVRGSLSIFAPALPAASHAIDFLLDQFAAPLPGGGLVDPAHCVMRGSVRMLMHTVTRLDQPGN